MNRRNSHDSSDGYRNKGYRPNYIHNYHKLKVKEPEIINKSQRVSEYIDNSLVNSILSDIKKGYTNKTIKIPELKPDTNIVTPKSKPTIFREVKNESRPQIKNTMGCASCGRR